MEVSSNHPDDVIRTKMIMADSFINIQLNNETNFALRDIHGVSIYRK